MSKEIERLLEAAKKAAQVGGDMGTWNYSRVLKELKAAIRTLPSSKNRVRDYTRDVLKMKGEKYADVRAWLRKTKTPTDVEDLKKILVVLAASRTPAREPEPIVAEPDADRRLAEHICTLFNSTVGILPPGGLAKAVYNNDRMQLQSAVQKICTAVGIKVTFPEPARGDPVTRGDLSNIGVKTPRRKK